jgi:hypothetical protein
MTSQIDLGMIVNQLKFQKTQHEEMMVTIKAGIKKLEEELEDLYAQAEQRRGAIAAKNETLDMLRALSQANDPPSTDPLAHSDQ